MRAEEKKDHDKTYTEAILDYVNQQYGEEDVGIGIFNDGVLLKPEIAAHTHSLGLSRLRPFCLCSIQMRTPSRRAVQICRTS